MAPHRCFGLLGADVMVDADGRPWLLEVNNCPNISGATGHVARDARAAAWRGDVFDNRASKNYEVRGQRRLQCVLALYSRLRCAGESCGSERCIHAARVQGAGKRRLRP